jgi:hypothetical protein
MPDQYYYNQLQNATQDRGETAEMFADRCRKLGHQTIRRVDNEATQTILHEDAEHRLVAAYINGFKVM